MKTLIVAAALLSGLSTPAMAKDWPSLQNWNFSEGGDFCEMYTQYGGEGEPRVSLILGPEVAVLGMNSTAWKLKKDQKYKVLYSIDENSSGNADATGWAEGDRTGFVAGAEEGFFADMLKAGYIQFIVEGTDVRDDLDLSGSDEALAQLRRCAASFKKGN